MSTIRNEQMGNATGLFALARNLAGSIGIAVAIAMVSRGALRNQAYLTAHLTPFDLPYQNAVQMGQVALTPGMGTAQAAPGTLGVIYKSLLMQTNMQAFADEFRWLALACFLSVPLVASFINVLDAERSLYQAQDALVQSDKAVTQNLISLYKALGGGWETLEQPSPLAQAQTPK